MRFKYFFALVAAFLFIWAFGTGEASAASSSVTWNPNDKAPGVTLSNNNLTASGISGTNNVRATLGRSTGKWYYEYHIDRLGYSINLGVATAATSLTQDLNQPTSRIYYSYTGGAYYPAKTYGATFTTGDVIGVALDLDNGTIEFFKNGVSQKVAFTDLKTLGVVYPVLGSGSSGQNGQATVNFGAQPFVYAAPAGFLPYDDGAVVPANVHADVANGAVNLTWDAVQGATSYKIKRGTQLGVYTDTYESTSPNYTDANVEWGKMYYYAVSSVSSIGESGNSSDESVIVPTPVPGNLAASVSNGHVNLTWDSVHGAAQYKIKRGTQPGVYETIAVSATNSYVDATAVKGTTYYYVVTAMDPGQLETVDSNEVSASLPTDPVLDVTAAADKVKVGDTFSIDIVLRNTTGMLAEDVKLNYDPSLFDYVGYEDIAGLKVQKSEADPATGTIRMITSSLGKDHAASDNQSLVRLTFKAKKPGQGNMDVLKGRIADINMEENVLDANCLDKLITVEGVQDVNRSGEYSLLDLAIASYYYGQPASATDTTKYDADQDLSGQVDDADLNIVVQELLKNSNYQLNL